MHEPARRLCFRRIETFAEEPEPASLHIFGAEIIAREAFAVRPPFRSDTLGSFDSRNLMQNASPAEPQGWPIRHACQCFDGFWILQQSDRALGKGLHERSGCFRFPCCAPAVPSHR